MTTPTDPRADALGNLFDHACDTLRKCIVDHTSFHSQPDLVVAEGQIALGIIDRYLAQQEADREHAFRCWENGLDVKLKDLDAPVQD